MQIFTRKDLASTADKVTMTSNITLRGFPGSLEAVERNYAKPRARGRCGFPVVSPLVLGTGVHVSSKTFSHMHVCGGNIHWVLYKHAHMQRERVCLSVQNPWVT